MRTISQKLPHLNEKMKNEKWKLKKKWNTVIIQQVVHLFEKIFDIQKGQMIFSSKKRFEIEV